MASPSRSSKKKSANAVKSSSPVPSRASQEWDYIICLSERGEELAGILGDCFRSIGLVVERTGQMLKIRASFPTLCKVAALIGMPKSMKGFVHTQIPFALGPDLDKRYEGFEDRQSFFTTIERERLVDHLLKTASTNSRFNPDILPSGALGTVLKQLLSVGVALVPACSLTGFIQDIFPPHDADAKKRLKTTWENHKFPHLPVSDIKSYFGEKIGFYFAWLEYYIKWLIAPAILGLVFSILIYLGAYPGLVGVLTSVTMIAWGTLAIGFWKRRQLELAYHWRVQETGDNAEIRRPEFVGDHVKDPITGEDELEYPNNFRWLKWVGLSLPLLVVAVLTQLGALYVFHVTRVTWQQDASSHIFMTVLFSVYGVTQNLMIQIYPRVATWLVNWENYKTEVDHEKHLVRRVFIFQFIASYAIPFYLVLVENDIQELGHNLLSLTLSTELTRLIIFQTAVPYVMEFFKARKAANTESQDLNLAKPPSPLRLYLPRVMQLGYVLLFSPAFPLVAALSLATTFIELKALKYDFMNLLQRPVPIASSGIGNWEFILNHLLNMSILSHTLILYVVTDRFEWLGTLLFPSNTQLSISIRGLFVAIAVEHLLVLLKLSLSSLVERNTPAPALKAAMRRDSARRASLLSNAVKNSTEVTE